MDPQEISLTKTTKEELHALFQMQLHPEANYLAAFTALDSTNKAAYLEKYAKHLDDPTINMQTIKANGAIIGSIAKFVVAQDAAITYWIDRKFWGLGIATHALRRFLQMEPSRPLFGRVAFDNYGSQRVLERNGFIQVGRETAFANARQTEVEEFIYKLSDANI
jgi:RimJ/RimL family protein N-acetyltransferase